MGWGIFLTRAQPFHNGHLEIIKQMLTENDHVLVIIGSANKKGTLRNPFDIDIRYEMVYRALYTLGNEKDRIKLITLNDWSSEDYLPGAKDWGKYLYYNIVSNINERTFQFYYNDDISIIENWFSEYLLEKITIKQTDRSKIMNGVSSTKIRDSLLNGDEEYFIKNTTGYHDLYSELSQIYKQVYEKPAYDTYI